MSDANSLSAGSRSSHLVLWVALGGYLAVFSFARAVHWQPVGTIIGPGFAATVFATMSLAIAMFSGRLSPAAVGLGRTSAKRVAAVTPCVIASVGITANLLGPLIFHAFGTGSAEASARFVELRGNLPMTVATVVLVAWVGAAFGEEVVFRGALLTLLTQPMGNGRMPLGFAVVAQAGAFGAIHYYQGVAGMTMAFAIGVIFGFSRVVSGGSIIPAILVHAIPDTMTVIRAYQGG